MEMLTFILDCWARSGQSMNFSLKRIVSTFSVSLAHNPQSGRVPVQFTRKITYVTWMKIQCNYKIKTFLEHIMNFYWDTSSIINTNLLILLLTLVSLVWLDWCHTLCSHILPPTAPFQVPLQSAGCPHSHAFQPRCKALSQSPAPRPAMGRRVNMLTYNQAKHHNKNKFLKKMISVPKKADQFDY